MKRAIILFIGMASIGGCALQPIETDEPLAVQHCAVNEDGTAGFCTCIDLAGKASTACKPMDPICPMAPTTTTTLANPISVAYHGDSPAIAVYSCGSGDGGTASCESNSSFNAMHVAYVAEFASPTMLNVYAVPTNAIYVTSPSHHMLFPLLSKGQGFDNPMRQVTVAGKSYYLDNQNDCVPTSSGCTCSTC